MKLRDLLPIPNWIYYSHLFLVFLFAFFLLLLPETPVFTILLFFLYLICLAGGHFLFSRIKRAGWFPIYFLVILTLEEALLLPLVLYQPFVLLFVPIPVFLYQLAYPLLGTVLHLLVFILIFLLPFPLEPDILSILMFQYLFYFSLGIGYSVSFLQSLKDPLTDFPRFHHVKRDLWVYSPRGVVCFLIDIDQFKKYNDEKGHLAGDHLLENVSSYLKQTFPKGSVIFRYGGDEFIILAENMTDDAAHQLASGVSGGVIVKENPKTKKMEQFSLSVGVSTSSVPILLKSLVQQADQQM
ncbi:GGDEF domain-containing protein [Microaerobacter geothermalis]|uniref:GGDEF domain-containing protein n=1 Tax=Microaerobacter geothermalis TaxID=674972 RepID=UPI001F17FF52|nr:GGDEF domain-containing protein [Microaerobacter geothermalis]MCF6093238.1 GGDEF domain-containing protein [Microaerobacter geothermalis]